MFMCACLHPFAFAFSRVQTDAAPPYTCMHAHTDFECKLTPTLRMCSHGLLRACSHGLCMHAHSDLRLSVSPSTRAQANAQLNASDKAGRTALEVAVTRGEVELCEVLLTRGAKPTLRKDNAGNTQLHAAVTLRSERLVRLLVKHKAELSDQNRRCALRSTPSPA